MAVKKVPNENETDMFNTMVSSSAYFIPCLINLLMTTAILWEKFFIERLYKHILNSSFLNY